jgi:hypothetical protein
MNTPPVEKPVATAAAEKRRHAPAALPATSLQRDHFEQALKRASHGPQDDKSEPDAKEPVLTLPWPVAVHAVQHQAAVTSVTAPGSTPAATPTQAAMSTSLRHSPDVHEASSHLSVELTDSRLPLAAIDVQRVGTRIDVALTAHAATRTDLSPMTVGRLRERLSARGADLGALTWNSNHHDEDEHDEH